MAQVSLVDLTKVFPNGVTAVDKVNLGIENKEFIVLVGPSGCGKSTTLRMIAGLEQATSGDLYIGDRKVNDVPAKDRNIAMVFQNYALYPHMRVYENMAFGLKLRKYPIKEINARVHEAAQILGIEKLLDRLPRQLSGGQRQRVAVGRAIVRKPLVFLFDEPLSNLDAKMRVQMRVEINRLHVRLQSTMIYVTHDQVEAMTLGSRIVVMQEGIIHQVDDPIHVYENPVNKFVASFIGSPPMNFIEGRIIKKEDRFYFDEGVFQVKIQDDMRPKLISYLGKEIVFGIRSENIYNKLYYSDAPPNTVITATVDVLEPMGSEVYLYLTAGNHQIVARSRGHDRPSVGQDMDLVLNMARAHFFDKDTEKAIA